MMPTQRQFSAFIRLSRLHFLAMPVLCYTLGITMALNERGSLHQRRLVMGLIIELLAQLSVAYLNDYWDMPTDRINTRRTLLSGGSGALTTGVLAPQVSCWRLWAPPFFTPRLHCGCPGMGWAS